MRTRVAVGEDAMRWCQRAFGVGFLVVAAGTAGSCGTDSLADLISPIVVVSNTTPITLPDAAQPPAEYPSTMDVSIASNNTIGILLLVRITHGRARDVDLLLVGPTGVSCLVMADCLGGSILADDLFIFSDQSTTPLPGATTVPLPSGNFSATNIADVPDDDTFYAGPPPVVPAGPYVSDLDVFLGTDPNGTWRLYAKDDLAGGGGGSVNAWQLWITGARP